MPPRILTVIGARPQFIKCASVSRVLRPIAREFLINTGQHYDDAMSSAFVTELLMPVPDVDLGIGSGGHGEQTGRMLEALESIMIEQSPDVVQVYGDTNSTLAGALAAAKLGIPIAHVEAGLRSWSRDMPEEINRVVTDHVSSLLLCPTEAAVANLANEGITIGVELVGDVMVDTAHSVAAQLNRDRLAALSLPDRYICATLHRPANVDTADRLAAALEMFDAMPFPVVIPVHPRTAAAIEMRGVEWPSNVIVLAPLGYIDMLTLVKFAQVTLTDSGGVQKESILVGTPCVLLRNETEWIETVEQGMTRLVGLDIQAALDAVDTLRAPNPASVETLFPRGASHKIADLLVHLASR